MALIPQENLSTLFSASVVKTTSDTAEEVQEEMSVARQINEAANCGRHQVIIMEKLSDTLKTKLVSLGYEVVQNTRAIIPENSWIIRGF